MDACGTPPRQTHQLGVPIPQLLKVKVTQSCLILCDPLDCRPHGISQEEYWNELLFPRPGDLPDPEIEPTSPVSPVVAGRLFTTDPPRKTL